MKNIWRREFWVPALWIAFVFFVTVLALSLLIGDFNKIIQGEFSSIYQERLAGGKAWGFFGYKIIGGLIYGMYMSYRNLR
jgi:hypothetical protein